MTIFYCPAHREEAFELLFSRRQTNRYLAWLPSSPMSRPPFRSFLPREAENPTFCYIAFLRTHSIFSPPSDSAYVHKPSYTSIKRFIDNSPLAILTALSSSHLLVNKPHLRHSPKNLSECYERLGVNHVFKMSSRTYYLIKHSPALHLLALKAFPSFSPKSTRRSRWALFAATGIARSTTRV